ASDRDQYRRPVETLALFGLTPTMTVLDVGPGAGYYTELLAPVLAKDGLYIATNSEPPSTAAEPSTSSWGPYMGVRFDEMLRASPALYGKVQVVRVDYEKPKLNLDGTVDMVLLMREVHMMKNWGTLDTWLREIHRALKPNGVLGVEDHRAAPRTDPDKCATTGYLPEAWVIAKIEAAGFGLAGKSEINANPSDTKDYPNGVWSLPPSFYAGPLFSPHPAGAADRAKYAAIGESDRMTLKFVKVTP
ncbi:MAG TPA: methyltransferase domain-containing protein, partial [Polyangiaceae bacterium]